MKFHIASKLNYLLMSFALLFLSACNSDVVEPIIRNLQFYSITTSAQIELVSNTTTANQAQCTKANKLVLQVSLPSDGSYLCSDQSSLIPDLKKGLTCPGGVSVLDFPVDNKLVSCKEFTICGVPPTSRKTVGERFGGGDVEELTFENLPWGCLVKVDYGLSSEFSEKTQKTTSFEIIPPECPYCLRDQQPSCLPCTEIGVNETITSGQVVFTACEGGACANCATVDGDVTHGQGKTFYSKEASRCGEKCVDSSQVRVCNNGLFEGDVNFQFAQCVDVPCGCKLPGKSIVYDSGKILSLFKTQKPGCGKECESINVKCFDGTWQYVSNLEPVPQATLIQYPETTCTKQICHCVRAGRATVAHNTSRDVYSKESVDCEGSCNANKGQVSCNDGTLTGDVSFAFDSCSIQRCDCALPWGGTLLNGLSSKAFKVNKATCDNRFVCGEPASFTDITCNKGTLSSFDQSLFKYGSCSGAVCSCVHAGAVVDIGNTVYFYKEEEPASGVSCMDVAAEFTCQEGGKFTSAADIKNYPYKECTSETDAGTLGGTGGGTGNDDGPGSALKSRQGLGDGGGAGGPCADGTLCRTRKTYTVFDLHEKSACDLPWGQGELEHYGSIIAFDKTCVVKPDTCTKHRQSRTCHYQGLTGDAKYKYSSCEEKTSCP